MGKMQRRQVAEAVARFIEQADRVTFMQLQRFLQRLSVPIHGPINLCFESDENVVLWSGMSEEMTEVVLELMREQKIFAHKASVATYHVEGGVLNLPLADAPAPGGLGQPHWLPVVFRPVPPGWALH